MTQNISQQSISIIMFFRQVLYISTSAWVVRVWVFNPKLLPFPYCFFEIAPECRSKVIKPSTSVWVQIKKNSFAKCCINFFLFQLFGMKNVEKHILTSFWSAQQPNAGQNIQQASETDKQPDFDRDMIQLW